MITSGTVAVTRTIRDDTASDSSTSSIPVTTPSTTEGNDSSGTFASFIAHQNQSSTSTPEICSDIKRPDCTEITREGVVSSPKGVTVEGGGAGGAFRGSYRGGVFEGEGLMLDSTTPVTSGSHRNIRINEVKEDRLSRGNVSTDTRQEALKGIKMSLKGPEMAPKTPEMALEGLEPALKGPEPARKGPRNALKGSEPALKGSLPERTGSGMTADGGTTAFLARETSLRSSGEVFLTRLYEGTSFGEMALIYDEPRNANIRATTKVELGDRFSTAAKAAAYMCCMICMVSTIWVICMVSMKVVCF